MSERVVASEELAHHQSLRSIGKAAKNDKRDSFDSLAAIGTGVAGGASSQVSCRVVGQLAIQKAQGLGSDRRDSPLWAARIGVGTVENLEERISQVAPHED